MILKFDYNLFESKMQINNIQMIPQQQQAVGLRLQHTTFSSKWQTFLDSSSQKVVKSLYWNIKFNQKWAKIFQEMLHSESLRPNIQPNHNTDSNVASTSSLPFSIVHISFPYLSQLLLGSLNLISVESLAFLDMKNLKFLDLPNNQITSLKFLNKQKWNNLSHLNTNRNKMRQIDIYRTKLNERLEQLNFDHHTQGKFQRVKNEIQLEDISKVVKLETMGIRTFILSDVDTYIEQPKIMRKLKERFIKSHVITRSSFAIRT